MYITTAFARKTLQRLLFSWIHIEKLGIENAFFVDSEP